MKKHIIIFLVRWYESLDKPMPTWLERACDQDTVLGIELDEERALTRALKTKPERGPVVPNPIAAERIIACLDDKERPVVPKLAWREISIGIAACIAIAIVYQWFGYQTDSDGTIVMENGIIEEKVDAPESATEIGNAEIVAFKNEWKNPLDQEIEYVLGDAKEAIDFLADTFLPSGFLSPERKG